MNKAQPDAKAARLARWCLSVTDYLATQSNDPSIADFASIVHAALSAGSVARLRSIQRDLAEWARGLTSEQQLGLELAIQPRSGGSLDEHEASEQRLVAEILECGEIRTDVGIDPIDKDLRSKQLPTGSRT